MFEPWSPHDEPGRPFDGWVEPWWFRPDLSRLLSIDILNWCSLARCRAPLGLPETVWKFLDFLADTGRLDPASDPVPELRKVLVCYGGLGFDGLPREGRSPIRCECYRTHAGPSHGDVTGGCLAKASADARPTTDVFDTGEIPFEVWDDEVVVKGQPSRWHEAVRAEILHQLLNQLSPALVVLTSSAVGDDHTYAQSDGSVLAVGSPESAPPILWIEVFSEADLRRREARLTGRRRSWFLSQHSVPTAAVFVEIYGTVGLHVFEDGRDPQSFSSPASVTVTLRHEGGELPVVFDLAAAADTGRRAEGD